MSKTICPLLRKPCIESKCAWWCTVRGYDANSGKELDQTQCIVGAIPFLLIENSSRQRGTQAAVESMRNEVTAKADTTNNILANILVAPRVQELPSVQEAQVNLLPSTDSNHG